MMRRRRRERTESSAQMVEQLDDAAHELRDATDELSRLLERAKAETERTIRAVTDEDQP